MKIDASTVAELMPEMRNYPSSTKLVFKAGGQSYTGPADVDYADGTLTVAFADKPNTPPVKAKKK